MNNKIQVGQVYKIPVSTDTWTYGLVIYTDNLRTLLQTVDDVDKRPNPQEFATQVAEQEWILKCDIKPHKNREQRSETNKENN